MLTFHHLISFARSQRMKTRIHSPTLNLTRRSARRGADRGSALAGDRHFMRHFRCPVLPYNIIACSFSQRVALLLPAPASLRGKLDDCTDDKCVSVRSNYFPQIHDYIIASIFFDLRACRFVDFIRMLLTVEPEHRPSATEAMLHPWFATNYGEFA